MRRAGPASRRARRVIVQPVFTLFFMLVAHASGMRLPDVTGTGWGAPRLHAQQDQAAPAPAPAGAPAQAATRAPAAAPASAAPGQVAPIRGTPPIVRDTTQPAEAVYGVTEYAEARRKLEEMLTEEGFTVYIIADMEGLAGAVMNSTEMRPEYRGGHPTHERFRKELTDEVNAAIAGARSAGATAFVVNDGHGGTLFRNTLPEELDPEAILVRGYPKPIVMSTGLNPRIDAMFIIGAHANAGSPGVIAHNFAFDSFTIDGRVLNEAGIAAFHGGDMGIPLVLATGDDVLTAETREMLGPIEVVTVKQAFGRSAAATHAPAKVREWIREAAARAVRRAKAGELEPLSLEKPYRVEFCMRKTYEPWVTEDVGKITGLSPTGTPGCFRYVSDSAEEVGNMINIVEWVVLKP